MESPVRHEGERVWLERVVDDLLDDDLKLVYADWLEERGDPRSVFLRAFVDSVRSMDADGFPDPAGHPSSWVDLIGFDLVRSIATAGCPEFRAAALKLARPALRMVTMPVDDEDVRVGGSKLFGRPDLPDDVPWPTGDRCRAIYNDDTAGRTELAGFCGQIDLAGVSATFAARDLPAEGVLSFFCYQDIENDEPDVIGAAALWLPDATQLTRREPPGELTEGNDAGEVWALDFEETLDLPESYDGPWSDELSPYSGAARDEVLMAVRERNFENVLGYARATSGGDPTPDQRFRHLIVLDNPVECRLHLQVDRDDLAARNFDGLRLAWVDFD